MVHGPCDVEALRGLFNSTAWRCLIRLAIAGGSYKNANLAAAAQTCSNLFTEYIEQDPGSGKAQKFLLGTPGYHLLVNLNAHAGVYRGSFTGGGRVFVVIGAYLYEIDESGNVAAGYPHVMNDPAGNPHSDTNQVQMFGNGNQLAIINAGYFYVDDGATASIARFQVSGVVTVTGSGSGAGHVDWVSGDAFPPEIAGIDIFISGQEVNVASWTNNHRIVLTAPGFAGSGSGTCSTSYFFVYATSGTFTVGMEGLPIVINGITYTVDKVLSAGVLTLTTSDVGELPAATVWSAVQPNLVYEAAAGDPVTTVTGAVLDNSAFAQRPAGGTPDLGRQVNFSAVYDWTKWNGLDFFTKESYADHIQSILSDREMLYVFGQEYGTEVWQNSPTTGRPVRLQGAVAQEASCCQFGSISMQEHLWYLGGVPGGGATGYRVDGFTPTRISTHAVEQAWALQDVSLANSWWYLDNGHYFWVIWFPSGSTWVYDATAKYWHERVRWTGTAVAAYRFIGHSYITDWNSGKGRHLVGDATSAKLFFMSLAFLDEEGVNIQRQCALPYLFDGGKRVYVGRVQLTQQAGATVNLDWSSDDGVTFTTPEAGADTTSTPYWIAQGSFEHSAIPRLTITGQTVVALIDCDAEVTYGTS